MRYYRPFRNVIPHSKAGHPRVTHPFATLLIPCGTFAFDLHVLGTPPALILSQDQTLMLSSLSIDAAARAASPRSNCLTRGRLALRCSIRSSIVVTASRRNHLLDLVVSSRRHGLTTPLADCCGPTR